MGSLSLQRLSLASPTGCHGALLFAQMENTIHRELGQAIS